MVLVVVGAVGVSDHDAPNPHAQRVTDALEPQRREVGGATIMCCVTTWMSRNCRCRTLAA